MVKNTVTKMVTVKFVDGEIKGAHDATWRDISDEIEKCSALELEALRVTVEAEYARRAAFGREADEEIALDAMND